MFPDALAVRVFLKAQPPYARTQVLPPKPVKPAFSVLQRFQAEGARVVREGERDMERQMRKELQAKYKAKEEAA